MNEFRFLGKEALTNMVSTMEGGGQGCVCVCKIFVGDRLEH